MSCSDITSYITEANDVVLILVIIISVCLGLILGALSR